MENFIVSARKYRPATFDTVVGQSSITTTLKNAIRSNHLAQAFLFCGPRGVGKTTCARILAKTINCFNITESIEACDKCESCQSFNSGHSLNIYELDAASNNSVDDIRNLVDQVRFAPQLGKYKIYIIDEVHMLSTAAFNAFLKTLEEPPAHAIFILATTEKHKIIPTILSRCQIFDFNRIGIEDIAGHLAYIANNEHIKAEPDALHIIAQKADGALRDACSIFDRIVTFAGDNVTYKAVIENLNILDYDYYFKVTSQILSSDISSCLLTFNEILGNGFDGHNFIGGLAEHFRNLLVSQDPSTLQLLEVGVNIREKYKSQSQECGKQFLLSALDICNKCDLNYRISRNQRLLVELTLMQLSSLNQRSGASDLTEKKTLIAPPVANPAGQQIPSKPVNHQPPAPSSKPAVQPPVAQLPSVAAPKAPAAESDFPKIIIDPAVQALEKKAGVPGGLSLKDMLQKNKIAETAPVAEAQKDLPINTFSSEQLSKAWTEYANLVRTQGKVSLFTTLSMRQPELKDLHVAFFQLDNKVQEDSIREEMPELLAFLRSKLNNYSLKIETEINKVAAEKRPYTSQDKYRRMTEINPALQSFRQNLDLEIE